MEAAIHTMHAAANNTTAHLSNPSEATNALGSVSAEETVSTASASAPVPPSGPGGATAQTSGFAQAGPETSSSAGLAPAPAAPAGPGFGGITGGGLASSPNVPKPGTTINPATGKPHTAGLTRAELEQIKSQQKVDEQNRRASFVKSQFGVLAGDDAVVNTKEGRRLSELAGREQAAKQLAGTTEGVATPGKELPGGWGAVKPVAAPGTGPNATTSIYEDVTEALDKVGHAAYNLMPTGVKEALSQRRASQTSEPGTSPTARRGSAAAIFESVKQQGSKIAQDIQGTVSQTGRRESSAFKPTPGRTSGTIGSEGSVLSHVKGFMADVLAGPAALADAQVKHVQGTAIAPRTSLPSEEPLGARPGEHTSGVGALPGKNTESGVAVLPDEKKPAPTLPSQENQGMLPGETSGGVGALPGKLSEAGVAIPPDVRKAEGTAGGFVSGSGASGAATPSTSGTSGLGMAAGAAALGAGAGAGLAAALPQTHLTQGAAGGATDIEATPGVSAPGSSSSTITAQDTRQSNDRTTSLASVTAIRGGTEGERHATSVGRSPLAGEPITTGEGVRAGLASQGEGVLAGQASAARAIPGDAIKSQSSTAATGTAATGASVASGVPISDVSHTAQTKSLTPGTVEEGVGHPSTRGVEGTTRQPGTYPAADHGVSAPTASAASTTAAAHDPVSPASTNSPLTPKSPATKIKDDSAIAEHNGNGNGNGHHQPETSHRRTGSTASTGSNGGKKVGFLKKLKGEIKVISGKIGHDNEKVEEGERIKHGEATA